MFSPFVCVHSTTPPPPVIRKSQLGSRYWWFLILTARKWSKKSPFEILVLFLNFLNSVGISFLIDVLTSKRFSIFWSFFLRTGPRECHIRIPREKLNSIHKFSARLVPRQPISWAIHVFAHFWSFFRRIGPRECHNRILRFKLYRVHQFSSKLAPGEPVSWPDHVFYVFVVSNMSRTFKQTTLPTEILIS